jgi:hypothetical protein
VKLPRSGIEIDGPFLRISAETRPIIELDARYLDDVREEPRRWARVLAGGGLLAVMTGAVAALGSPSLGFLVGAPGTFGLVAAHKAPRRLLRLELGGLRVHLSIADGPKGVAEAVARLRPWTRSAPIIDPDVYQDARRRLEGRARHTEDAEKILSVGKARLAVDADTLWIGSEPFSIPEVRALAQSGGELELSGGAVVQAALALLVVEIAARAQAGEDTRGLKERIAAYEAFTGRFAAR